MAKRGRPALGKTKSIRVPEAIYQMLNWIADCDRRSVVRVAEELLTQVTVDRYLALLPVIIQLKALENQRAANENRDPIPLPKVGVFCEELMDTHNIKGVGGIPVENLTKDELDRVRSSRTHFSIEGVAPSVGHQLPLNLPPFAPFTGGGDPATARLTMSELAEQTPKMSPEQLKGFTGPFESEADAPLPRKKKKPKK